MCMDVLSISNVCGLCACLLPHRSEEGIGSPRTGVNRWLWATMWMLGTKPTSSARATVLLTTKHLFTHPQIYELSRLYLALLSMVISASECTLPREIRGENLVCFIRGSFCVMSFQHPYCSARRLSAWTTGPSTSVSRAGAVCLERMSDSLHLREKCPCVVFFCTHWL